MKLKVVKTENLVGAAIYKIYPTDLMISNQNAHNTANIEFKLPEEWQGLTIRATFTPNGKPPVEMLIIDNAIKLNSDITSENGVLVIDAFNDNLHYYATDCRYTVARHSNVGGNEPEYTPTQIEQILSQTQGYTNSAIEAKNEAVKAKEQAETASQHADGVKADIDNEKSNIENFVEGSKRIISSQTTDSVNAVAVAGTESAKNAKQAIEQQTAISIKSIENKSTEEQQAISEFVRNEARQIISDSKVEIANETNLSKTEISDFTLLKVQRIEQKTEEKLAEINADETVQKVNELVRDFPKKLTQPETASVGQIFKVKSINDDGTMSLEAVDMPSGGGSSAGVQPDWNQNDDTQPDFVKNRPFYVGNPVETVLVEEITVTFEGDYSGFQSTFEATVGETYKVYWDGTAYECTCTNHNDELFIGNLSIIGAGSDTGEPFIMMVVNGRAIDIAKTEPSASHTISISGFVTGIVKIDEKYLPENIATKLEVEAAQTAADNAQATVNDVQNMANINKEFIYSAFGPAVTFTFDKQISGRDTFVFNDFDYYKISDFNPVPDDVISFKGTAESGTERSKINIGSNCVEYGFFIVVAVAGRCSLPVTETATLSFTAPSTGLYAMYNVGKPEQTAGTGEFTLRGSTGSFSISGLLLKSSTVGSTKKFKITVDDSGTISATEVT